MAGSKSWSGITSSIFACVKTMSEKEHGTKYEPPGANTGTATTETAVGTVKLGFVLSAETLTYTIQSKPFIVTEGEIWGGINEAISHCRG
jgi:hypothetical protein